MPGNSDDSQLRAAFDQLHTQHSEAARRFARVKLGAALRRRVDSEDVRQEVFLEAWRAYQKDEAVRVLRDEAFAKWLGGVVHNQVLKLAERHLKSGRRSVRREERQATEADRSRGRTPSEIVSEKETRAQLLAAIGRLSPREQEVVRLVHLDGLRVAEAAEKLGKTPGATSVLLSKALGKLEKRMGLDDRRKA